MKKNIILTGKSGTGKDTILNKLVEKGYSPTVSVTSRPKRPNEVDGKDYHFVTKEEFKMMIENKSFVEYRTYNTLVDGKPDVWYYGTAWDECYSKDNDKVMVLDLDGVKGILKHMPRFIFKIIYLVTSDKERERRAKERGGYDKSEFDRRVKADKKAFSWWKRRKYIDKTIKNENIDVDKIVDKIINL